MQLGSSKPRINFQWMLRDIFTRMRLILCSCLIALTFANVIIAKSLRESERHILEQILGKGYDPRVRPDGSNHTTVDISGFPRRIGSNGFNYQHGIDGPVAVTVNMVVRQISNIDSFNNHFDLELTLRQNWRDSRLRYESIRNEHPFLTLAETERIWKPDLFFSNEGEGRFHNVLNANTLVRIYPEGDVLYSIRISLRLWCQMELAKFPFDKQNCSAVISSYGSTTDDIVFLWKEYDPVQFGRYLRVPLFKLLNHETRYCNSRTITGEYSCIVVDFSLDREVTFYVIKLILPTIAAIVISWLAFWISPKAALVRVAIHFITILIGLAAIFYSGTYTPPVSYSTGIDVWNGITVTFLLAAFLELILVIYFHHRDEVDDDGLTATNGEENLKSDGFKVGQKKYFWKGRSAGEKVDIISRIIFPIVFIVFCVIYWPAYASG